MIQDMMKNSEIVKYFYNNLHNFQVSEQEKSKTLRERRLYSKNEANGYILGVFKEAVNCLMKGKEDTFIFSISEHTVAVIHNKVYFHIQIMNTKRLPEFQIKTMRPTSDFHIHNYKNHGLRVTNHLMQRYMQYFKKFVSFANKHLHKETFEQELMTTLKNKKTYFARELTDTVYLVVDNMYFVLKKQGKNTISLVTMRPFEKTLELTPKLKKLFPAEMYSMQADCDACNHSLFDKKEEYIKLNDKAIHKSCLEKKYSSKINYQELEKYGETYLQLLGKIKTTVEDTSFNNLVKVILANSILEEQDEKCVCCYKPITLEKGEYYERNYDNQKIHHKCAHGILDIKNTEKIFINSGLKGLYATASLQSEQKLKTEIDLLKQELEQIKGQPMDEVSISA